MRWFKIHHGFNTDVRLGLIAHNLQISRSRVNGIFVDALEYASKNKPRGSLSGYDFEAASLCLGEPEDILKAFSNALRNRGMLFGDLLTEWDLYQQPEDYTNAERQRKHRNKKKQSVDVKVEASNGVVTDSNALCNTDKTREEKIREEGEERNNPLPILKPSSSVQEPAKAKVFGFDVKDFFDDAGLARVRREVEGWCPYMLAGMFNEKVNSGALKKPTHPIGALIGWSKKYTKGKQL
jgi:hypothetical protein